MGTDYYELFHLLRWFSFCSWYPCPWGEPHIIIQILHILTNDKHIDMFFFNHVFMSYLGVGIQIYMISYTDYWQCIWAHIHDLSSYEHEALAEGLYAFKPYIYNIKNLYNDCIILQYVFLTWKLWFLYMFTWKLFTSYHNWSLTIQHMHETSLSPYDVI